MQRYEEAIVVCEQTIARDPLNAATYALRGETRLAQGYPKNAILDFGAALKVDPRTASLFARRAQAYRSLGDGRHALDDALRAQEQDPKSPERQVQVGLEFALHGRWAEAATEFSAAAKEPRRPWGLVWQYLASQKLGQSTDDALAALRAWHKPPGVEISAFAASIPRFLGGQLAKAAFLAEAEQTELETNGTTLAQQRAQAWYYAGLAAQAAGEKERALECFRKCVAQKWPRCYEHHLAQQELAVQP